MAFAIATDGIGAELVISTRPWTAEAFTCSTLGILLTWRAMRFSHARHVIPATAIVVVIAWAIIVGMLGMSSWAARRRSAICASRLSTSRLNRRSRSRTPPSIRATAGAAGALRRWVPAVVLAWRRDIETHAPSEVRLTGRACTRWARRPMEEGTSLPQVTVKRGAGGFLPLQADAPGQEPASADLDPAERQGDVGSRRASTAAAVTARARSLAQDALSGVMVIGDARPGCSRSLMAARLWGPKPRAQATLIWLSSSQRSVQRGRSSPEV